MYIGKRDILRIEHFVKETFCEVDIFRPVDILENGHSAPESYGGR